MNSALNPGQSDTRVGDITLPGSVDLTGKENLLVKIVNNGGIANFALPTAVADQAGHILASGDIIGQPSIAEAPSINENCRVLIDSVNAINPGDMLALSPNSFGKLYKPKAGDGAGFYTFVAESAVAAGAVVPNPVKVRRIPDRAFNL
ncbi:MAG TPA: hypothetical protein VNN22_24215 [Verrucomicrobiae bacterium]|nr:hypothetical protein [Verrucomicrobiae bacterium]